MTATASAERLSRSATGVLIVLLAGLVLAGMVFGGGAQRDARPAYAPDSAQPDGTLALSRWLAALGYDVGRLDTAAPPMAADALVFVWPGQVAFTGDEAGALLSWVERGGTLALIGPTWRERALGDALGVRLGRAPDAARAALAEAGLDPAAAPMLSARQPLVPDGPTGYGEPGASAPLDLYRAPAAVVVIGAPGAPTVALQARGRGRIWHFSPLHDFSNGRLADSADRALLPPLLRHVPAGGRVRFDAYHLGLPAPGANARPVPTLRGWLWGSGPGRAILLLVALAFAALALGGLRLGPPLPSATAQLRRTEAEYVTAMAGLHRRAGDRALVADHERARVLGTARRALGLPPSASAGAVGDALAEAAGAPAGGRLDPATAARLLAVITGLTAATDEATLLRWSVAADRLTDGLTAGQRQKVDDVRKWT